MSLSRSQSLSPYMSWGQSNDGGTGPKRDELYCLWNPSVRRYIRLPSLTSSINFNNLSSIAFGFGFDDKSGDYKVVVLVYLEGKDGFLDAPNCQLFSLKQGCWRTLPAAAEEATYFPAAGSGLFVKGALHWLSGKYRKDDRFGTFVLAFDIASETFKRMELPLESLLCSYRHCLLEIKGSLVLVDYDDVGQPQGFNNCYSIWVMKEYGVGNSWVKMWTLDLMGSTLSWVCGFWGSGDEILIEKVGNFHRKGLFLYDIRIRGLRDFGRGAKPYILVICAYTESLILLDEESRAFSYEETISVNEGNLIEAEEGDGNDDRVFSLAHCFSHHFAPQQQSSFCFDLPFHVLPMLSSAPEQSKSSYCPKRWSN